MKILSVYYTHKPGGLCMRLYRLLEGLHKQGHQVTHLSLDPPPAPINQLGIFHRIPFPFQGRKGLIFWCVFSCWLPAYLTYYLSRERSDRIVSFNCFYSCAAAPAAWIFKTPIVSFVRSLAFKIHEILEVNLVSRTLSKVIDRVGLKASTHIIAMTEVMKAELCHSFGLAPEKVSVLPNDLPPADRPQIPKTHPDTRPLRCVIAGVFDRRKNISLLGEALNAMPMSEHSRFEFHLYGDGPDLAKFLQTYGQNPRIISHGWAGEVPYGEFDLLIHPSLHEGIANVLLEALSLDLPVLASDIPEQREILLNDILLFDPHDPNSLSQRLQQLAADRGEWERLVQASKERAKNFRFDWLEKAVRLVLD